MYMVVSEKLRNAKVDVSALRNSLSKGSDEQRVHAMEQIVAQTVAGDNLDSLLMDIIRFVLPSKHQQLKKLLHAYWEVVTKHDEHGKLRPEMILVVNGIRNDLMHPNEYILGGTLRFLVRLNEPEILEPLVPSVRQALEHRHAYVRKNAVFCVLAIAQSSLTDHLIPDAAELLANFLANESDNTCKRNAFVALSRLDRESAYAYFHAHHATMEEDDEQLQLALVRFAAHDALATPSLAPTYVQMLEMWLERSRESSNQNSFSAAVAYECATALSLVVSPAAADPALILTVGSAYVDIAVREIDINVKLTALHRVSVLREAGDDMLQTLVLDVLLLLPTQDIVLRRAALSLALQLVSSRTVDDVLRILRKELQSSLSKSYDTADEYRLALIDAIHQLALRFSECVSSAAHLLLEVLGELNTAGASEVMLFLKEVVELHPQTVKDVLAGLARALPYIHSARVYLSAVWIMGEYSNDEQIASSWEGLREAIGPLPFTTEQQPAEPSHVAGSTKPRVLADGTYATESPLEAAAAAAAAEDVHHLRKALLEGDFFLGGGLSVALTKLALKSNEPKLKAEALLVMASILRLHPAKINEDAFERIYSCINLLVSGTPEAQKEFVELPHAAFKALEARKTAAQARNVASAAEQAAVPIDEKLRFRRFAELDAKSNLGLKPKTASSSTLVVSNTSQSQLKQVTQLTGYSDPVYAEALMTVSQFDIILDVMIFNQTRTTLENLKIELFTTGELKLVEQPIATNVAPMSFHTCRATVRVSSVDAATIFGDIAYDCNKQNHVVLLNDIRLNIMDYIRPETCTDEQFRQKWVKFEWENKVPVLNQTAKSLPKYLEQFTKRTNMRCLTDGAGQDLEARFLSANLYARSCFGEAVLANLSVELKDDNSIVGHVRVRAKQKGAAVSVGDCALTI